MATYTIKINEKTKRGKVFLELMRTFSDVFTFEHQEEKNKKTVEELENDFLIKKTQEALNDPHRKTHKMKNPEHFFKSLGWS